jgi:hypothetical protein
MNRHDRRTAAKKKLKSKDEPIMSFDIDEETIFVDEDGNINFKLLDDDDGKKIRAVMEEIGEGPLKIESETRSADGEMVKIVLRKDVH